jgi:hypothetical protein
MRRTLTALSLLALISVTAHAAVITKVSGEQVLIDLQGDSSYTEGSRYLLMVGDKKKAVVEISKVKGDRAIGKVLKGTAQVSGTLAALPTSGGASSAASSAPARSSRSARSSSRRSRRERSGSITYGGVIGYGSTSQTVAVTKGGVSETIAMTGSSISLKGFADLPISENFGVAGSSPNLGAVETKIMYLSADVLMRYLFLEGKFRPFPLLGMGLHYPLSKSSGVLDVQRISATTIFFLGGGFNYTLNETMYLHATLEYGLFPPSNDVKTSLIAGRIGVGFNL